jgi:hypothetical protein
VGAFESRGPAAGLGGIAFWLRYFETRTRKIFIYSRGVFGIVNSLPLLLHRGDAR